MLYLQKPYLIPLLSLDMVFVVMCKAKETYYKLQVSFFKIEVFDTTYFYFHHSIIDHAYLKIKVLGSFIAE